MAKRTEAPIFKIGQHCLDIPVRNIKVSAFSDEACSKAEFDENHRHSHYEIIWLKKGRGIHNIDMVNYAYSGSVLFLLSPGQMHHLKPTEKAEGYVVKFLPSLFSDAKDMQEYLVNSSLFDNIQAHPLVTVSAAAHNSLEEVFNNMEAESNANETDKEKMMLAYLKILITHINRLKKNNHSLEAVNADSNLNHFQQYKILVEKNFRKEHSVQFYADQLYVQTRTLNSLAKKYAGKTAGEIISERILLEAKRELYYNTNSVKEIGYGLGFDDPAYFTRFFKKQSGLSPQEYKTNASDSETPALKAG